MFSYIKISILLPTVLLLSHSTVIANDACVVPVTRAGKEVVSVTEQSRLKCFDEATIAFPQPDLSLDSIRHGPGGMKAITSDEPVYCEFIPYKMNLKSHGKSLKFWCYRTDSRGRYYNDQYELVEQATRISQDGHLLDANGRTIRYQDGTAQKPEVIKVKYTNGGNRGREVYTEVAVTRFLWAMGFPADHMFSAQVLCKGCTKNPFRDIRTRADNHPSNKTHLFTDASIERKVVRMIETKADEGWKWEEVYIESAWDQEKRTEFEAYVLALNMAHFHHGISKQNTLGCRDGRWDTATGVCSEPVLFLDDPGSSLGGDKSRGKHEKYRENTVFMNPGSCDLRADLAGFRKVSEPARRFLADRLAGFTEESARAIFEAAGFNSETTDATLDQWVSTFMERIREVQRADCG